MQRYQKNLLNYPYTVTVQRSHKKGESKNRRLLCEDIFTFDIETTSFFYDTDLKPFLYEPGRDPDYWAGVYAGSLPYIWQFGINDKYYYGRDISEFYELLNDFPPDLNIRIAVHNLPFEFHHLDKLTWIKVFAKTPHKPITATCSEHPNIQFYCTYSLTNRSLESWGKMLGVKKLVGFLDYNRMRTPLTPLTAEEMAYSERDLKVMYEGIKDELKVYNSVWKLPLTSTGKVRRIARDILMEDEDYRKWIKKRVPADAKSYDTSIKVFTGGYCHANKVLSGMILYNDDGKHGQHVDYTSDYPFQMVLRKLPSSPWAYCPEYVVPNKLPDPATFEDTAYKLHLVFKHIRCETQNTYIPKSKCSCINEKIDNGRVLEAEELEIWCTELDYEIIRQTYTYDPDVKVLAVYSSVKDYLPLPYVKYILELFRIKTELKGIDDAEVALRKGYLNSLYGLMVTALLSGEVKYLPDIRDWKIEHLTESKINEHLDKLRRINDKRYFLNFDWGVWVTAYARWMLWSDIVIPYDKYVAYCDTDSAFLIKSIDWTDYNNKQNRMLEEVCRERGLDIEATRPKNKKGKQSFLGSLTIEEEWTEAKFLRAKCYCERWKSDGKLHLTVAGINKEAVSCLNDDLDNFKDRLIFDKDEKDVNKLLHTYVENMPSITFPDGYVSHQKDGVNLRPNSYQIKIEKDYNDLLKEVRNGFHSESYENHLKSVWYDDVEEIVNYALTGEVKND